MISRLSDPVLAAFAEAEISRVAGGSADIVVTDQPDVAVTADRPVAFIGSSLEGIMLAVTNPNNHGILHPRDLTIEILDALSRGISVFSAFEPADLEISELEYRLIFHLAHSTSMELAAKSVGYSARHVRRLASGIRESAGVAGSFGWARLAPLLQP